MVASPTQKAPVWYVPNVLREAIKDFGKNMSFGTVNGNNNDNNNTNNNNNDNNNTNNSNNNDNNDNNY